MNYLPMLTEDEAQYICSVIPHDHIINYFRYNPKEFAQIRPGFRAQAISRSDASRLLFNYRDRRFVSVFIEEHISDWLSQIKTHFNKCIEDGDSKDLAYIHTLPSCFFADNVALYFKLIDGEHSEEYVASINTTVTAIKEATDEQDKLQKELEAEKSRVKQLQSELNSAESNLEKTTTKLSRLSTEMKTLKRSISEFEKLRTAAKKDKMDIVSLKAEVQEKDNTIKQISEELSEAQNCSQQLEEQIRAELEKRQNNEATNQVGAKKAKRPNDMKDFKDYLE